MEEREKEILQNPPYTLLETGGWEYKVKKDEQYILTPTGKHRTWRESQSAWKWIQRQRELTYIRGFMPILKKATERCEDTLQDNHRQLVGLYSTLFVLVAFLAETQAKEVQQAVEEVLSLCTEIVTPLRKVYEEEEHSHETS